MCMSAAPGSGIYSSNYGTVGRPVSLPISRQQRVLSNSDPDLTSSNPTSPDNDTSAYSGEFRTRHFLLVIVLCFCMFKATVVTDIVTTHWYCRLFYIVDSFVISCRDKNNWSSHARWNAASYKAVWQKGNRMLWICDVDGDDDVQYLLLSLMYSGVWCVIPVLLMQQCVILTVQKFILANTQHTPVQKCGLRWL